jgi:hypothetical protein
MRENQGLLRLVQGSEPAITGTVVCAAAISYTAAKADTTVHLILVVCGTVFVYWLAHLHASTLGSALTHAHHPLQALRHSLRETLPILGSAVLPLAVLIAFDLLGAEQTTAEWAALITTIALLVVFSYQAGVRGGLDAWGRLASCLIGAALGLLVVLLKILLH